LFIVVNACTCVAFLVASIIIGIIIIVVVADIVVVVIIADIIGIVRIGWITAALSTILRFIGTIVSLITIVLFVPACVFYAVDCVTILALRICS